MRRGSGEAATDQNPPGPLGRRQFLLSPDPVEAPPWFGRHELGGWHLYACPTLPVALVTGPRGRPRALLGVAVDDGGGDVLTALRQLGADDLMRAYRSWSGRWVLVDDHEVHLDATGMLSAYLCGGLVASTPALLPGLEVPCRDLRQEHILPFFPGPDTGIPGVRRLLPGQVLQLETGEVRPRRLPDPAEVGESDAPAVLEELGSRLLASVAATATLGRVVVPLTAGYDSRLALAACVELGIEPLLVTQGYPGMTRGDRDLPPLMAARLGLRHDMVPPGPRSAARGQLYDRQVAGLVREGDRAFMEKGQFAWLRPGDVLLRGVLFDGTRGAMHARFDGVELDADQLAWALGADDEQRKALRTWVGTVRADPQTLGLHDRFWYDQKCASYAAVSETALDLLAPHSVLPGNSVTYQELALSLPWSWRRTSRHHTELVSRWAPAIADVPYNPPRRRVERLSRIPGAVRRRARSFAARRSSQV